MTLLNLVPAASNSDGERRKHGGVSKLKQVPCPWTLVAFKAQIAIWKDRTEAQKQGRFHVVQTARGLIVTVLSPAQIRDGAHLLADVIYETEATPPCWVAYPADGGKWRAV